MSADNQTRFRRSAAFPFLCSTIAFSLVLVLVVSGKHPNSSPDGYLLSFNTTSVGENLVQFSPATPAAPTTTSARRDLRSISASSNVTISQSATSSNSTSSDAPTLVIPQATVLAPTAIPITLVGVLFQLILNTLASGVGQTVQTVISTLVTTQKTSFGVPQYYTFHVSGICQGSVLNITTTNTTSPYNITTCISYSDAANYIANLTNNVSSSFLIGGANVTVPALRKVPDLGKSTKSFIDSTRTIIMLVFVLTLMGNATSMILSAAAFILPTNRKIHTIAAGITTLSTQLLQIAAITSSILAISISSGVNNFSDATGLRATVGEKFLATIWFGYIAAQLANGYWVLTWFTEFRTTAFKKRERTLQEMNAGYRGVWKEVRSDFRVQEVVDDDMEGLRGNRDVNITHWNDEYKQM